MRFLTADIIYSASGDPLENGMVIVNEDGSIEDVLTAAQYGLHETHSDKIEKFSGFLCPGFINSHCHLELSNLKGLIDEKKGMSSFIRQLLQNRFPFNEEIMQQSFIDAENEMLKNGIVAVGDISNFRHTLNIKKRGRLYYHTYIELTGLKTYDAGNVIEKGKIVEILDKRKENPVLLFVDDFVGTGDSVVENLKEIVSHISSCEKPPSRIVVAVIVATVWGLQKIQSAIDNLPFNIEVHACDILDEPDRIFVEKSKYFEDANERAAAKDIIFSRGKVLKKKAPLGYGDCELAVVFEHGCPNNSIPVLWSESAANPKWVPLFLRS